MAEKRDKPLFFRTDWTKKLRLGSRSKKKRKWRHADGRHNKVRLNRNGHPDKPTIGWGSASKIRDLILGVKPIRVETVAELENLKKGAGIIVGSVGIRKRNEIIKVAESKGIKILNRYKKAEEKKNATS